jgi:hypothetical protein
MVGYIEMNENPKTLDLESNSGKPQILVGLTENCTWIDKKLYKCGRMQLNSFINVTKIFIK